LIINTIGKFEDRLGSFKEQSTNNAVKQWVTLQPVKAAQSRSSSPLKEQASRGPRALIIYYFGDKSKGTAAIQEQHEGSYEGSIT
jgi:hypothetical protein